MDNEQLIMDNWKENMKRQYKQYKKRIIVHCQLSIVN